MANRISEVSLITNTNGGQQDYYIEPLMYAGTTSGTSSAYTISLANFEVVNGASLQLTFNSRNSAGATLSVNGSSPVTIYYNGESVAANQIKDQSTHTLIFDGKSNPIRWIIADSDTNTDTTYSAGTGLTLTGTTFAIDSNVVAAKDHTHNLSLAESTDNAAITLAFNKKYKLTAGGKDYILGTMVKPSYNYSDIGNRPTSIELTGAVTGSVTLNNGNNTISTAVGDILDDRYSAIHQTSWDWASSGTQPFSKYVTFDVKSTNNTAPKNTWFNGFVSSHSDYLASFILNEHRTSNWYVGYEQYQKGSSSYTAPTWYLLAHSGNVETGTDNGEIKIAGVGVKVQGLDTAAYKSDSYFAKAEHGTHVTTATVQSALGVDNSTTNQWLNKKGEWSTLPVATNSAFGVVQTGNGITNTDGVISVTASNLGLSNAMHFIGIATKAITDGGTEDPTIDGYSTKTAGDVVIDKDTRREYVWSTANKWELLGFDASTKYEETTSGNTFISKITQDTDGTITAESRALDTTGTWSGTAEKATYPVGFSSRSDNATWGYTSTGTTVTAWNESDGGSIEFRKNVPSSGKLSIKIDGRFYGNEGNYPAMLMNDPNNTSYWGMGSPDGANNVWIRTTTAGIIPFQAGGATGGHGGIGTSSWYFSYSYIQNMYGNLLTPSIVHRDGGNIENGSWLTGATGTAPTATTADNKTTYSGAVIGTSILTLGNNKVGANSASGVANNSKGYLRIYGANDGYGELSYNDSMFSSTKSIYLTTTVNSGISNEIRGVTAGNDYWRVAGGATASNSGYMEIATADDSNEPIYVRQYSGVFKTLTRTITLLDASGNTEFPVQITAPKFIGEILAISGSGTFGESVTITGTTSKAPLTLIGRANGYREGIRIKAYNNWSDIVLGGADLEADEGISENSWFIGNNNGNFYITRNGSTSSSAAILKCVDNDWTISGTINGTITNANHVVPIGLISEDLDEYKNASTTWYYSGGGNDVKHKPTDINAFGMYVYRTADNYRTQELYASNGTKWMRYWDASKWNAWEQVLTSANYDSLVTDVSNRFTAPEITATRKMVINAGKVYSNITGSNVIIGKGTTRLFGDGLAISNPATSNDVGWLRVLGTGETDTVFEIATGDDGGAGEQIVVRQYTTSNTVNNEAILLGKEGETNFPVSVTTPATITDTLSISSTALESHIKFARNNWNYITYPNNSNAALAIGFGTGDNTNQQLVIYQTGTVRPGSNGTQNLGDSTHRWNNIYAKNITLADKEIWYTGTKATKAMIQFLDNTSGTDGNGIKIGGGGLTVIGSGESAGVDVGANAAIETLYLLSDNSVFVESACQNNSGANRVGLQITTSGHVIPVKAEKSNNNVQNLGAEDNKWANVYATTFNGNLTGNVTGDLSGNAATTDKLKTAVSLWGNSFDGSASISGNLDWGSNTYRQRILITDDSTADTAVFTFQQSTDSGTNYSALFTIKDNGNVIIGNRISSTTPSSAVSTNRIAITPYFHTDGPWYIASKDDKTYAYLTLKYGSTERIEVKSQGKTTITSTVGTGASEGGVINLISNAASTTVKSGTYQWGVNHTVAQLASGAHTCLLTGVGNSAYNQAVISYNYVGSGNTGNSVGLGLYNHENYLVVKGTGEVSVTTDIASTSTSTGSFIVAGGAGIGEKLYVAEETHAEKYIVNEKVTLQWNSTDSSLDFVFA